MCPAADLGQKLDALIGGSPLAIKSTLGIRVVDLRTGEELYTRNAQQFFLPASNMKLFTSALALTRLGADYRFVTRLIEEPSGDVVLVGSGDPSLSGRVYPYRKDARPGPPLQAIEDLADQAVAHGLHRVNGDVVGDDRLYPWAPYPPNWTQDDIQHDYGAPVSALSVNDNTIAISIAPGARAGDLARLSLSPPLEYFAIDNRIATVAAGRPAVVHLSRVPGTRQLLLSGKIPVRGAVIGERMPVDDPALYAACALYEALTRRGVTVTGHPVARHRAASDPYQAPTGETLAVRTSPPLTELLQVTDKVSQNLHAELMLREVGRLTGGDGTRENGLKALDALLAEAGASPADARVDDGSGLSRNAQVTPQVVTRLLAYMFRSPLHDVWIPLLPVGGEDGTLAHRLCCSSDAQEIHAKTGTLARAVALSGYGNNPQRGWLAFSILVNDFSARPGEVQAWIDKIALALVE
jgi:serine-type D-Ala-D-Ala carboxypeptidase/endopeptidase (penicillin-binding protein 4)